MRFLLLAGDGPTEGVEPDVWSVEYPSLWSPSEKETADTRKTDMDRAVAAVNAGIVSADDVAESFYGGEVEMRAYALHLQLHFLATRFASMRRMRGLGGRRVSQLTNGEDFPAPLGTLTVGRVWSYDDVKEWAERTGRTVHPIGEQS